MDTMPNPIVTITMENGDVMKVELYPDIAPNTVNNFISLVKKGFYDGLIFHRVIPGFMHPNSAGSQFFLMHQTSPHLDGAYAAFGKITEGLAVVDKIAQVPTGPNDKPVEPQVIQSMTVDTQGTEYPQPDTL